MTKHQGEGKKPRKMTVKGVRTAERHRKAVELKAQGKTNQQIAEELGYANRGTVSRVIRETLDADKADATTQLLNRMMGDVLVASFQRAADLSKPSTPHAHVFIDGYRAIMRALGKEKAVQIRFEVNDALEKAVAHLKGNLSPDVFEQVLLCLASATGDRGPASSPDSPGEDSQGDGGKVQP